jgi:hypothetical protein
VLGAGDRAWVQDKEQMGQVGVRNCPHEGEKLLPADTHIPCKFACWMISASQGLPCRLLEQNRLPGALIPCLRRHWSRSSRQRRAPCAGAMRRYQT